MASARELFAQVATDRERVPREAATSVAALRLFELLPGQPIISVASVMRLLATTKPTAGRAIQALQSAHVLVETTGRRRNRSFVYRKYFDSLSAGTELEGTASRAR